MSKPIHATRAVLALTLLALALAACGVKGNPHPKTLDSYVSLGDSYTALAGTGPFIDSACKRTETNYPHLVAKDLGIKDFTDVSCGGATSAALTTDQAILKPRASRSPQLEALTKNTKLVTLG